VAAKTSRPANRVLSGLSDNDFALLAPQLIPTSLKRRQQLQASSQDVQTVYFLERGIASVVVFTGKTRRVAEVAIVGVEGIVGLPVILDGRRSSCEVFMLLEGSGQRISADDLRAAINQSPTLLKCLLRYAHAFAVQSGYAALANAHGSVLERLARWLLMAHDRTRGDKLVLTHECLSATLAVRRASVTMALKALRHQGAIEVSRGCITVMHRRRLEACANGLYGAPEAELERLFPLSAAAVIPFARAASV